MGHIDSLAKDSGSALRLRLRTVALLTLAAAACALPHAEVSAQQSYPAKPVRFLTSTPGGPYDIIMRGFSVPLGQALGKLWS